MNKGEIREAFLKLVNKVAPDIDPADVSDDDHLQDDLELDSMDILNLVTALHETLGVSVSETDYQNIETTGAAVRFLMEKLQQSA
ncbi:acyl carrier protein [Aliiroseovarius sp. S253]|uniref:acyl carrier protein n=1 Tax=Aliiroseovarius sp. S253 TaxID=3415133 RepID=UPI003C7DFD0E